MGKDELRRIFVWKSIPIPIFAAIMIMFFGYEIIRSELSNLFELILPVPQGFFEDWFYMPESAFMVIVTYVLFPPFVEEVLYRGIIARKFFKTYSPKKSILMSAALFGIMHINPWQMINSFFGGIFYGWVYWRYRSIWLCMFMHAYHNIHARFFSLPFKTGNLLQNPIWFDILGFLFWLMDSYYPES
jgi:membrane protease YdiL (CAAX protease family)